MNRRPLSARSRSSGAALPRTLLAPAAALVAVVLVATVYWFGLRDVGPEGSARFKLDLHPANATVEFAGGGTYEPSMWLPTGSHRLLVSATGYRQTVVEVVHVDETPHRIDLEVAQGKRFVDGMAGGGDDGPEMVALAGGSYRMGCVAGIACLPSELPVRAITVRAFAIGRHEVTFGQYDRFASATGRDLPDDHGWGRGMRPVINVAWADAVAYADWLSAQTGARYRLPTEAEWEFAARAGSEASFWSGPCLTSREANYFANDPWESCPPGRYREQTVEVATLPANAFGLHEVLGNVAEWVQDCWHPDHEHAASDGRVRETAGEVCMRRVVRGGSWLDVARNVRVSYRFRQNQGIRATDLGFRLARSL